jgi:hypothetical protein
MLQSRRGFLIGAGALLTTAFVADARSFIRINGRPLLARPTQVAETLYWYDNGDDSYLLTLGEWTDEPPPVPPWREFFITEDIPHQTEDEIEKVWEQHGIWPEDYDKAVCERYWWGRFEIVDSPCAKAYRLLEQIDLGPNRSSTRGPLLEFHQGAHPGDSSYWVNAKDELSLSLLQARLIDLKMPIKIAEG